ncbi:MgtC/SapB family protein [Frankia sp. QA3]|uniref:MgtC/SapB family protein n=1 Tax=Frankia sp. QA3 TaxID=710111 RepID=UPI000269D08D|nr:MgtC/SapB family protein [Frankia sp. QA3]EIV95409.1 putative membrane protein [Frankia sp. QA3]
MVPNASSLLAAGMAAGHGQGWRQVGELLLAFGLSSVVGLERRARGKSAGLRTQTIVGTASALFLQVSKYGFGDVLAPGTVVLDPSRVAAQVVSGIGFLGAGLILTRGGTVRGLTTAASVWETAAIGMAAGAGLPLLAVLVTALHFVVVYGYTTLANLILRGQPVDVRLTVTYLDGRGVLRRLLGTATGRGWTLSAVRTEEGHVGMADHAGARLVRVALELRGTGAVDELIPELADINGVVEVAHDHDADL